MNITPKTMKKVLVLPNKVVAFDTVNKKPIAVFKSKCLASEYFFNHKNANRAPARINYIIKNKSKTDLNIFGHSITFRTVEKGGKFDNALGCSDFVLLDEKFRNEDFINKHNFKNGRRVNEDFELNDEVEIISGSFEGLLTKVIDIRYIGSRKQFGVMANKKVHYFNSYALKKG